MTRYPLYGMLGEPRDGSGRMWKISPPPGFDLRPFQPVASRYTDYVIPTHFNYIYIYIIFSSLWNHIYIYIYIYIYDLTIVKSYIYIYNIYIFVCLFVCLWRCDPTRVMASSFLRFLDHTQRRTTFGITPVDEWSARRRDLYLTTHNTHNRQYIHAPGGIRTHDLRRRAAADLRLRPRGHWNRPPPTHTHTHTRTHARAHARTTHTHTHTHYIYIWLRNDEKIL